MTPEAQRRLIAVREFLKVIIMAAIIIVGVRYFLFKPFVVRGASMEPNFFEKEYLIIDEISYRFRDPLRGDIVVFRAPNTQEYFLKRIIALPGERVKVGNGKVFIYNQELPQGKQLDESVYLPTETGTQGDVDLQLNEDQYFVLGDHRQVSFDSRRFGAIHRDDLVGRAWVRGLPLNRISRFTAPQYGL
ncbi:MAG: signal peptidase I, signal peptidase I [Candidatus Magasanikbacteria bacterium]|nr:signal peptidase I, signal peptidase I [Candidatus Magasanikbacteria bacterium]